MFKFVVKRLGFLKRIPLLPHLFDSWIKIWIFFTNPDLAKRIDSIETELSNWNDISLTLHKYGGTQFNYCDKEIAHIHSNGLLDILFDKKTKEQLLKEERVTNHHIFENSGWISFYVKSVEDKEYAIEILRKAYEKCQSKNS